MSIKNEKGGRIHDCSLLSIALAVILLWPCERVFADNPRVIGGLELSVTTATLSVAQRRRGHAPIRQWGELGLAAGWRERAVVALAPQQASAVSQHFREQVLEDGDYHRDVVRIQGAARMTDRVSHDADSIGYIARSQWNGMSKVVPVSAGGNGDYVEPTPEEIMAGHYPLGFWLRLYVNHNPREPLDEQLETLLRFCYSRQGQQLLAESGYIGVPEAFVASELEQIGRELR